MTKIKERAYREQRAKQKHNKKLSKNIIKNLIISIKTTTYLTIIFDIIKHIKIEEINQLHRKIEEATY